MYPTDFSELKVAIVHYWLISMRGGEKVLEALCEIFPSADIYTHVYNPSAISETINKHSIFTTFIQKLPASRKKYQLYLPLMPLALEQLDLRGYDIVISSESGPAKGVITSSNALHICYCHTPMRYVWDMYFDYLSNTNILRRLAMPILIHYLRLWDYCSAARVDYFIANSNNIAKRIKKHYRRESTVIHPPVATTDFYSTSETEDFYLIVGQLVKYKRVDIAIQAFNAMQKKLFIIGDGEEFNSLKKISGPTVHLLGRQPFNVIRDYYARAKALIFPGEEDFGIVPLEAMASGRPVIAFGKGGARETIIDGLSGLFFQDQTAESLIDVIKYYETIQHTFSSSDIVQHASLFDKLRFKENICSHISSLLSNKLSA